MDESKENALQAAMLAKLVGSTLNQIDSLTSDRKNLPANRIDMNQFLAPLTNNTQHNRFQNQPFSTPTGFAAPPPEDLIRQMIPDPPQRSYSESPQSPSAEQHSQQSQQLSSTNIENILKNIDKNLQNLIDLIKNG